MLGGEIEKLAAARMAYVMIRNHASGFDLCVALGFIGTPSANAYGFSCIEKGMHTTATTRGAGCQR